MMLKSIAYRLPMKFKLEFVGSNKELVVNRKDNWIEIFEEFKNYSVKSITSDNGILVITIYK